MTTAAAETALDREVVDLEPACSDTAADSVELNAPGAATVADGDDTEESSDTEAESRLPGFASQSTPSSAGSTVRPTSRRLPRRSNAATGTNNWNAVRSVALA